LHSRELGIVPSDPAIISTPGTSLDVVAYSIGDWVGSDNFEVVTAWVHPRYRGLRIALNVRSITEDNRIRLTAAPQKHYIAIAKIVEKLQGRYLTFDVLTGTLEAIYKYAIFY